MWFPVLGVVCAGLFVGAAVSQFVKHSKQQDGEVDDPAEAPGDPVVPDTTAGEESDVPTAR